MKLIVTGIAALGLILSIATSRAQESLPLPSFGNEGQTTPLSPLVPTVPDADSEAPPVPPPPAPPSSPPASSNTNPTAPSSNAAPPLATDNVTPPSTNGNSRGPVPLARDPNQPVAATNDFLSQDARQLDLIRLNQYSDRLAAVTRCLHADAFQLCPNHFRTAVIQDYVDQLTRLQHHLHQLLCDAVATGNYFAVTVGQIQADVEQVRTLTGQLYYELRNMGIDGSFGRNRRLIARMNQTIVGQATPLLRLMEQEINGCNQYAATYGNAATYGTVGGFCPVPQPTYSLGPYASSYWD